MARSNIPMTINLRQNTNDDSTAYGKYFAEGPNTARLPATRCVSWS